MDEERLKDVFSNTADSELQFTKEDRQQVFEQIRKLEKEPLTQKKSRIFVKKYIPVTVSLLAIALCLFLFMPSLFLGGVTKELSSIDLHKESNTNDVSTSVAEEADIVTTLITVKSKEMDNRVYVNLLLTYNKEKKLLKVVSPSHFTYAPVADSEKEPIYDQLMFAYHFGGAENVRATVSKLFDVPIDYYAVIDLETFSTLIDVVNGIEYDLQKAMRVRGVTHVAFDFEQGTQRLSGEEVVALMMATTEKHKLDDNDLLQIMNSVVTQLESEISSAQFKKLFAQIEANVSFDELVDSQKNININSVKSISLHDGMMEAHEEISKTEGKFYYKFENEFLEAVSKELMTFE